MDTPIKITLKVAGDELLAMLAREKEALDAAFVSLSKKGEPLECELSQLPEDFAAKDLLNSPEAPSVILVGSGDTTLLNRMQSMERRELHSLRSSASPPSALCPLVMIFSTDQPLNDVLEFPEVVSDWMFGPVVIQELARRIFSALKRKHVLRTKLKFGAMTLLPEQRQISFHGKTVHLTPSEFALAELFLNQIGTVISLKDLAQLFKATGKSAEGSNIRVTIFQLRLKLEMLTKSQFTVTSVYRQGYCLKQKAPPPGFPDAPLGAEEAREDYQVAS